MSALDLNERLSDISEARDAWLQAQTRERNARAVLVLMVQEAREGGARLEDIAGELRATRQYVSKLLKSVEREQREVELAGKLLARQARTAEVAHMRGLGFTAADRQCGVCHRFKSAPSAVCDFCGDDPVTYNGSARDYDAAYAGGIR